MSSGPLLVVKIEDLCTRGEKHLKLARFCQWERFSGPPLTLSFLFGGNQVSTKKITFSLGRHDSLLTLMCIDDLLGSRRTSSSRVTCNATSRPLKSLSQSYPWNIFTWMWVRPIILTTLTVKLKNVCRTQLSTSLPTRQWLKFWLNRRLPTTSLTGFKYIQKISNILKFSDVSNIF